MWLLLSIGSGLRGLRGLALGVSPGVAPGLQLFPGPGQNPAQDALDLVEHPLIADQGRGQLNHRVAAVIGAAVQPGLEQFEGQEAAQQPLAEFIVEDLFGGLVLDQFDPVEEALAADVTDDR